MSTNAYPVKDTIDGSELISLANSGTGNLYSKLSDVSGFSNPSIYGSSVISVKKYGAKGDGVTNDAAAINAAATAAALLGYGTVYIPYGNYFTGTTTVTFPANVSVYADNGSMITYTGSGDAVVIQSSLTQTGANMFYGRTYWLPAIFRGTNATPAWSVQGGGTDTTSVGLHITSGMQNCEVHIPGVLFFNTGVLLDSTTAASNIVCNNFFLGRIINCCLGLHLLPQASWGVNQNQFYGGSIRADSALTTARPSWKIWLDGLETNNNTFIGTNLELGSPTQKALSCASSANEFIGCRLEGGLTTPGFITYLSTAQNNHWRGGAGGSATLTGYFDAFVSDAGFGNVYEYGNVIAGRYMKIDWQQNYSLVFGNGAVAPAVPIEGYGTDRLRLGNSATVGTRYYGGMWQEELVVTTGTTLVGNTNHYQLNYASPTTLLGIGGAAADQTIASVYSITDLNGNITLTHTAGPAAGGGKFVLKAGVNLLLTANLPILFVQMNGNLYQT